MSDLLFAVGGTGQHIALAVARLVRLGALPKMECRIIDSDDNGALPDAVKTFGGTLKTEGMEAPMEHPLHGADTFHPTYDKEARQNATLESLFVDANSPESERILFELFFDEHDARVLVSEGMFAQPNVGSTVFALSQGERLRKILEGASNYDRIFVTGSVIGGTGAGTLHQLIRTLRKVVTDKPIYAVLLLRWLSTGAAGSGGTVTDPGMDLNARHGLDYLWNQTRSDLAGTLLLGVPSQPLKKVEFLDVAGTAGERASFLHLAAAWGLAKLPESVRKEGRGKIYGLAHDPANEEALLTEQWEGGPSLLDRVHAAVTVADLLEYAARKRGDIAAGFGLIGRKYIDGLHQSIRDFSESADVKPKQFVAQLAQCWKAQSDQLRFAFGWVGRVLGQRDLPVRLKSAIDSDATRKQALENAWKQPISPPQGDRPDVVKLAEQLEDALMQWALG